MHISPDSIIIWQQGWFKINLTIVTTWGLMLALCLTAYILTRGLEQQNRHSRWQNIMEIIVISIMDQLNEIGLKPASRYIGFIGTLFLFIATANLAILIPGYYPPTASLSTTAALALAVFVSVPVYGIRVHGIKAYLATYMQPVWIMLPFNLIGELSRTLALAIRLFGNMMSGAMIGAILLIITPLFFPLIMNVLGLLTGMVQAYIFAVLAMVYIAAATRIQST